MLIRLARLMQRNCHELAVMESIESGKPVRDCASIDLEETIHCLIWHAEAVDKIHDQSAPVGEDAMALALRVAHDIRAGTVTINCYGEGDITTPFGGYKQSGFGGRDNSLHAHDQYTELKTIWIDLSDRNQADPVD